MPVLNRKQIIYRLREIMLDQASVRFAYLYGSRALGFERPDSDVDVAAYFEANGDVAPELDLEADLKRELGLPVQVIDLSDRAADNFFRKVLPRAVVIKESPERTTWEKERGIMASEDMGTVEDYLKLTLNALREKNAKLREALPLLDRVDLGEVKKGDLSVVQDFLGAFFLFFEPLEAIARRMANYVHWTTKQPVPTELKEQIHLLANQVGLDEVAAAPLIKFANVRNKVAHAYWNLKEEELSNSDLRAGRKVLEEMTRRVEAFIAAAREDSPRKGEGKNHANST